MANPFITVTTYDGREVRVNVERITTVLNITEELRNANKVINSAHPFATAGSNLLVAGIQELTLQDSYESVNARIDAYYAATADFPPLPTTVTVNQPAVAAH